jgi:hypothetical protein
LKNTVEYAFQMDPNLAGTDGLPRPVWVTDQNETYLAVEFTRRTAPSGLTYHTSVTEDFTSWFPGGEFNDAGLVVGTLDTTDISDPTWTRVRLNHSVTERPLRFIAVHVELE